MQLESVVDLAALLRRWHLLQPTQEDELSRDLMVRFPEPRLLARELVKRGWLSMHQIDSIFQGRAHELLLGSYVLLEKLGEGGMGAVFKARNWKLGRVVALKLIRKERLQNPEAVRRFQREVRVAALLDHPNVIRALDADEVGGTLLLTMEYAEGTDLHTLVASRGPLPDRKSVV